jgi:hypothetical protein
MTTQLPSRAVDPSLKDGERQPLFNRGSLAFRAAIAIWLLGWPFIVDACAPFLKGANAFLLFLLGTGCFIWFISWLKICVALFAKVAQTRSRSPALYRSMGAVIIGWFLGFPVLLYCQPAPADHKSLLVLLAVIAAGQVWFASGYWIYDALLSMAEARWPAAKAIREIVSPLLKGWLLHHTQHPHSSE